MNNKIKKYRYVNDQDVEQVTEAFSCWGIELSESEINSLKLLRIGPQLNERIMELWPYRYGTCPVFADIQTYMTFQIIYS